MSSGREAAQETKDVFKGIQEVGEEARKNVNSFADELIGGNKTHKSTGFSQDAKIVGDQIGQSVDQTTSTGATHNSAHGSTHTNPQTTTQQASDVNNRV